MPCNGGNYHGSHSVEYRDNPKLQKIIDSLTRKLCYACDLLEKSGKDMGAELNEWHYEHKLEDAARMKEAKIREQKETAKKRRKRYLESVKERVLGQLDPDEKEALGLSPFKLKTKYDY
jgi:hypothetical protein